MRRFATTRLQRLEKALQAPPAAPAFHVLHRGWDCTETWDQLQDAYVAATGRSIAPHDVVVQVQYVAAPRDHHAQAR